MNSHCLLFIPQITFADSQKARDVIPSEESALGENTVLRQIFKFGFAAFLDTGNIVIF